VAGLVLATRAFAASDGCVKTWMAGTGQGAFDEPQAVTFANLRRSSLSLRQRQAQPVPHPLFRLFYQVEIRHRQLLQ